jgi:glutamyl-Q tRNA(Asp) synthetase
MQDLQPVFRFAPSPNGHLHLGHAYSALFTAASARRYGGRFLLRIEDIDLARSRPEYEASIYEDLAWLGLSWERPVRRQSEHFGAYAAALDRLDGLGLIYPCFATRREIAGAVAATGKLAGYDPDGAPLYPGLYRNSPRDLSAERIAAGEPYALRLDMAIAAALARELTGGKILIREMAEPGVETMREAWPERWGDIILARKDVPASYHLAVVTDDVVQGITHVTRGMDLHAATDIHRLLQILLGLPDPAYYHHRLIMNADGRKLSKAHGDTGLAALRAEGVTARQIKEMVGLACD